MIAETWVVYTSQDFFLNIDQPHSPLPRGVGLSSIAGINLLYLHGILQVEIVSYRDASWPHVTCGKFHGFTEAIDTPLAQH